jgi:putative SbcD/Mre11-related phosphoesterase
MGVEPIPDVPAATIEADGQLLVAIADYHAGVEAGLRYEGVELRSAASQRRERLSAVLDRIRPDRLVVIGDLGHAIGEPFEAEREELSTLLSAISIPMTLVKGNHDGDLESVLAECPGDVTVTESGGTTVGDVGFVHGHTWPEPSVLESTVVCLGHEHPTVRLEDEVGGTRTERVWLRGSIKAAPFETQCDRALNIDGEIVCFPAFNDLSGGTWVNVDRQSFLSPFLPNGLTEAEAFLLDGTRLGEYRDV